MTRGARDAFAMPTRPPREVEGEVGLRRGVLTRRRDAHRRAALAEVAQVELDEPTATGLLAGLLLDGARRHDAEGVGGGRHDRAVRRAGGVATGQQALPRLAPHVQRLHLLDAGRQGWTNHEIAEHLYISLSTVKTHLASLMRKLDTRNRVEMAMWAYETGRVRK